MNGPPVWLLVAWSAAMTVGVLWQPRWMHRLFGRLVELVERIGR